MDGRTLVFGDNQSRGEVLGSQRLPATAEAALSIVLFREIWAAIGNPRSSQELTDIFAAGPNVHRVQARAQLMEAK